MDGGFPIDPVKQQIDNEVGKILKSVRDQNELVVPVWVLEVPVYLGVGQLLM